MNYMQLRRMILGTMPSLTVLLPVIAVASITVQVHAQLFLEDALGKLERNPVVQSKHLKDKYHEPKYDEDNDNNLNSINIQDLSALLEQVLNTNAEYEVKKPTYDSKKQKYNTYLDTLNDQNLDNVLVHYPDSKRLMRSKERPKNTLGLLNNKVNSDGLKEIQNNADQKESPFNKKRNYEKNLLDQLNELTKDNVLLYDPDSDKPIRTESKQKNTLMELESPKNAVDSDDLNDEALVYVIQLDADAIQNNKFNILNDLVSTQFKMPPASEEDRRDRKKEQRYKGFRVKKVYRRMRGDSNEKFVGEDSVEKRPIKRPHKFGGVARTPIPYIRHRGDIYEKA